MIGQGSTSRDAGRRMHAMLRTLYPMFRGLTGRGNRQTLRTLARDIPLSIEEAATGSAAFDWTVPREWRFREAWVADRTGRRIIDAAALNLHVVNHSRPVRGRMSWSQLRPHLHTLPDRPGWTPYQHAFFADRWGFCLSHHALRAIERRDLGPYDVCIDASFADGSLTYGEVVLPGQTGDQMLISAHLCHPSLCNDNLSGLVIAAELARRLMQRQRRLTHRFVFAPATLGAIVFLSRAGASIRRVRHGLVLTGLGDPGPLTYKRSRRGNAPVDVVARRLVESRGGRTIDFSPSGYDERQYCSPGFDLPMGVLMRTEPGRYPQYHTSADDPDFVTAEALADSLEACDQIVTQLDALPESVAAMSPATPPRPPAANPFAGPAYRNLAPFGEPQLSRRDVFAGPGAPEPAAVRWLLNLSDGVHDLPAIAERGHVAVAQLERAAARLVDVGLLEPIRAPAQRGATIGSLA